MGSSSDIDISIASVYAAWRAFRRGKRVSQDIMEFEYRLEEHILQLADELSKGNYQHGGYRYFEVNENKRRLIAVAPVRDRVVHRLLYEYLVGQYDTRFLHAVWSCRKNKGLVGAVNMAQCCMRQYQGGWVWRSDIAKFFDTVNQTVLTNTLSKRLQGTAAFYLCCDIIGSYSASLSPGVGVPIGNLTSQIFANIYLNEFDRFVTHILKPLAYLRYGDDIVAWCANERSARTVARESERFLAEELRLALNPENTALQPVYKKLHFCGVDLWPNGYRLDKRMHQRIFKDYSETNYASYRALLQHYEPACRTHQLAYCACEGRQ